ncbi:oligosaccharide flippase family protein [Stenotrophomonas sp.]|uniref:lipopolysaccharide biosynthesis protein n=1 Tax=Stenotrophomonas sp. TaxID=69392 RepID=UPI002FCC7276
MPSPLARNTALMVFWQVLRAGLQAVWAIGLARVLGLGGYGTFAGLAGLATALGALSGIGFGLLMLQAASRDAGTFALQWRKALWRLLGSSMVLGAAYLLLAIHWLESPVVLIALLAIAIPELLLVPLVTLASYAFQAHDRMGWAGAMYALGPLGNVVALLVCVSLSASVSLTQYLQWHVLLGAVATAMALLAVARRLRPGWAPAGAAPGEYADASGFLAMRVVDTGLGTLDKSLVYRLAGADVAGHYTAAYRLAALIALPAVSLAISAAPKLFRRLGGAEEQARFLRRLAAAGVGLGLVSIPVAWALSFALPWLFGAEFAHAADLARLNCLFPALLGLSALGCTMLMARGRKRIRIGLQLGALLLLLVLMVAWVPAYAGAGAVLALGATYLLLVAALWWTVWRPAQA